jgi:hypothetical protein
MEKDPTLATIQRSGITKKSDQLFGNLTKQVEQVKTGKTVDAHKSSWIL